MVVWAPKESEEFQEFWGFFDWLIYVVSDQLGLVVKKRDQRMSFTLCLNFMGTDFLPLIYFPIYHENYLRRGPPYDTSTVKFGLSTS